ncbi:hypothetical protein [Acinetobacter variabilis]|uniref:hypothetical protein n=1 Tax=Acinetobacter variabilis TaxID=70346 RepID=UPI0035D414A2
MEFTANKNLIKKDEKLFIVNKFDNFFYRELAIDARANFFGNNFNVDHESISISISSRKIDIDQLFIRFGNIWNPNQEKEILIETVAFRNELCSLEFTIKLLLILIEIAEKFGYRTLRFIKPSWVSEYICLKFGFSENYAISSKALGLILKSYLSSPDTFSFC